MIRKLDTRNLDSIITLSGQLQQIAGELKDDKEVAYSIGQMAWAYKHKHDLGQSIRYYFQLERLYQQLEDNAGLGTAYYNIGMIFVRAHENDKALQYLERAKEHYGAAGQDYKVSLALYDMAKRYIEKKDPKAATGLLFQALSICPKEKDSYISMIYNRLGWAAKDQQDHTKAREYYRKSLSVLGRLDESPGKVAIAYNNIGESYLLERQQYDSAVFYLQKALTIKETLNDPDFTLSTLTLLGKLFYQRGQFQEAFQRLDRGISQVDPAKLSKNVDEVLALVTLIVNDPALKKPLPHAVLAGYMNIQQQQFLALQGLKEELDRSSWQYHVQIGVNQDVHEQVTKTLEASVSNKEQTLTKQQATIALISSLFALALAFGLPFIGKLKQSKQKVVEDKEAFVRDLIGEYDHKIIQLMIVKAEYEELLGKRKKDQGSDDDDFGGD